MARTDVLADGPLSPCPCCGFLVHAAPPGSWFICRLCGWEDDLTQLRWPTMTGGANAVSLVEAQLSVERCGVTDPAAVAAERPAPGAGDRRDDGWRRIDLSVDAFEPPLVEEAPWPEDRTALYWWRPTFWRRSPA